MQNSVSGWRISHSDEVRYKIRLLPVATDFVGTILVQHRNHKGPPNERALLKLHGKSWLRESATAFPHMTQTCDISSDRPPKVWEILSRWVPPTDSR